MVAAELSRWRLRGEENTESLYSFCITIGSILFPDSKTGDTYSSTLLQRTRNSFSDNGPKLQEASRKTSREILQWTRRGSPLRALLVITMEQQFLLQQWLWLSSRSSLRVQQPMQS